MKCGICGQSCRDIGAMGKHYRKNHPRALAARKKKTAGKKSKKCPHCGRKL